MEALDIALAQHPVGAMAGGLLGTAAMQVDHLAGGAVDFGCFHQSISAHSTMQAGQASKLVMEPE
jgi:hypothetical protein